MSIRALFPFTNGSTGTDSTGTDPTGTDPTGNRLENRSTAIGKRRLVSIRWTLPLCVITPLVSGIALTGWLAFNSGQQAVDQLVSDMSEEVAANIEKQVRNYLDKPVVVSAAISAEVAADNLNADNVRELGQSLWHLTRSELLTDNLYYGSEQGEFVYSEYRSQSGQSRLDFVDATTDFKRLAYRTDERGQLTEQLSERDYDPRVRPWYEEAVEERRAVWSPVYIANSTDDLTLTRATPIYNEANQLTGVFGIDIYLNELSSFMREMNISENSRAFIIEASGEIVASSADEKPFIEEDNDKLRLTATSSQDLLIRETAVQLASRRGELQQDNENNSFEFELEGATQLAYVYHFQDLGVDWLIGVAIPQDDYMGTIRANMKRTIIVGLVITLTASLLALAAALHIIRPINKLTQAAHDIKDNHFDPGNLTDVVNRMDEFSELAELFNDMAIVVVSREQSLAEQVQLLKSEIDQSGRQGDRQKIELLLRQAKSLREAYRKQDNPAS